MSKEYKDELEGKITNLILDNEEYTKHVGAVFEEFLRDLLETIIEHNEKTEVIYTG
jgi:hypothetical protein